jgi:hypothetical protein
MAGITQRFTTQIKNNAGVLEATENSIITGDAEETFSVIAPGSGNVVLPITVDQSSMVSFWVVSDVNGVTMTVNDDGSPDLTVVLAAGVPYWWVTGKGTNPITADVTDLKFTKAGAGDATVKGGFLTT